jgi:hypothetical protein
MVVLVDKGQAVPSQRGRPIFGKIQLQINFRFICCRIVKLANSFLKISNSKSILDSFAAKSVDLYFWKDHNPTPT